MNPEIKPVLEEISAILKKHDMAGLIIVGNKTHVDYKMEIEPSWSCARLEPIVGGQVQLRVRSKIADYPDAAAQKESLEKTIGTFISFNDAMGFMQENMANILVAISRHVDIAGRSIREQ